MVLGTEKESAFVCAAADEMRNRLKLSAGLNNIESKQ